MTVTSLPRPPIHGLDRGDWETPIPLGHGALLPPFPIEALPDWCADEVTELAVATQTPPDLPGMTLLGVLSGVAGGRARVQARAGWVEPTNTYLAVFLDPGNRKSQVVESLIRPLREAEADAIAVASEYVSSQQARKAIAEKMAAELQRKAATAGANGDDAADSLAEQARKATVEADQLVVASMPTYLVDDSTPEALANLMSDQRHSVIACITAEPGIFDIIGGRYSKGIPNLDVYLKGHAGDELRVNRVGRKPELIREPALTLCIAGQPSALRALRDGPSFKGRGLLARFMLVRPDSYVGRREPGSPPVPDAVKERYERNVKALMLSLTEAPDPVLLKYAPEADAALLAYERELEPHLGPGGRLEHVADWGAKLAGAVVRFSGLLHLAQHFDTGYGRPVTGETFDAARKIGDYFLAHAMASHEYMGGDPILDDAEFLLRWVATRDMFSRREAQRASQSRFRKASDLDAPLAILEDRGWIRRQPDVKPGTEGGRQRGPTFDVHPLSKRALTNGKGAAR